MFSKIAVFIAAAALVAAVPAPGDEPATDGAVFNTTTNKCNVGSLQCCQSVQHANNNAVQNALGLLNIPIGSVQLPIGLTCNPISVIGVGAGANCNATPACCSKNQFGGAVAGGCLPINANL